MGTSQEEAQSYFRVYFYYLPSVCHVFSQFSLTQVKLLYEGRAWPGHFQELSPTCTQLHSLDHMFPSGCNDYEPSKQLAN
jgi:hypothetical protein